MEIKTGMRLALGHWSTTRFITVTLVYSSLFQAKQSWDDKLNIYDQSHNWIDCDELLGFTLKHPSDMRLVAGDLSSCNTLPEELID